MSRQKQSSSPLARSICSLCCCTRVGTDADERPCRAVVSVRRTAACVCQSAREGDVWCGVPREERTCVFEHSHTHHTHNNYNTHHNHNTHNTHRACTQHAHSICHTHNTHHNTLSPTTPTAIRKIITVAIRFTHLTRKVDVLLSLHTLWSVELQRCWEEPSVARLAHDCVVVRVCPSWRCSWAHDIVVVVTLSSAFCARE
jgi:hypothetical protein